jgi:hypothetical protein
LFSVEGKVYLVYSIGVEITVRNVAYNQRILANARRYPGFIVKGTGKAIPVPGHGGP